MAKLYLNIIDVVSDVHIHFPPSRLSANSVLWSQRNEALGRCSSVREERSGSATQRGREAKTGDVIYGQNMQGWAPELLADSVSGVTDSLCPLL